MPARMAASLFGLGLSWAGLPVRGDELPPPPPPIPREASAAIPAAPTGVALHGEAIYALEYPSGEKHEDWVPRVRKVDRGGKTTTLVTFPKTDR